MAEEDIEGTATAGASKDINLSPLPVPTSPPLTSLTTKFSLLISVPFDANGVGGFYIQGFIYFDTTNYIIPRNDNKQNNREGNARFHNDLPRPSLSPHA
jgi:hypothetical protein